MIYEAYRITLRIKTIQADNLYYFEKAQSSGLKFRFVVIKIYNVTSFKFTRSILFLHALNKTERTNSDRPSYVSNKVGLLMYQVEGLEIFNNL